MHFAAYTALLLSMLLCLALAGVALLQSWNERVELLPFLEKGHWAVTALYTVASAVLFAAFAARDFSFLYVHDYSDQFMPLFYTLTAFWAGQAGSLLFWGWCTALFGLAFAVTPAYRSLDPRTRSLYWMFFFAVMAFFGLLLTTWSNPFLKISPAPADGNGMNPLLQNPGMIFHPPLLFLGYAGFTVPGCLCLAQMLSGEMTVRPTWIAATRNVTMLSWLFLTAGIILGAWWSYMELGWGGYWAWDPVENASLIPWLTASAFIHTAVIETRRGSLRRTNVFLMALTLIMCFFGTYLVRSGVIDSLHAFGDGGVGGPLLVFILVCLGLGIAVSVLGPKPVARPVGELMSREGFLIMAAWLLLVLGLVIMVATMWPVISTIWSAKSVGLDQGFYNKVCLPLFALLGVLLLVCPWLGWKGGFKDKRGIAVALAAFALTVGGLFAAGYRIPLALLGAGSAVGSLVGIVYLLATDVSVRRVRTSWAAYGIHIGLVLMILGVSISGPYKVEAEATLHQGESMHAGDYIVTYEGMREGSSPAMAFVEATLTVDKDGETIGVLTPQRRQYRKFERSIFAEAGVLPGLGDEIYATLLSTDAQGTIVVKIGIHPLVNWLWIGGTLMCLFPLAGLAAFRGARRDDKQVSGDAA